VKSNECSLSIKERSLELGFSAVGIADLSPNSHGEHLSNWLSRGMAGSMTYMHRQARKRLAPSKILPGATRAVVVMRNYFNAEPDRHAGTGLVAKYARGPDYHDVLQAPLSQLVGHITSLGNEGTIARPYVDAGPVPERELAQRAGLGWIGKNAMLIHPKFGSHLFLATVLTNLDLAIDEPFVGDRCGKCQRCLEGCPTKAIDDERMIDSRRCISYLTIEHRGQIADELQRCMKDWIFGCDICQNVCPWNVKFAAPADDPVLSIDPNRAEEDLESLCEVTLESFGGRFGNTPLERTGIDGLRRNARIALQNGTNKSTEAETGIER
jgi:epoxyqueuosine reductase